MRRDFRGRRHVGRIPRRRRPKIRHLVCVSFIDARAGHVRADVSRVSDDPIASCCDGPRGRSDVGMVAPLRGRRGGWPHPGRRRTRDRKQRGGEPRIEQRGHLGERRRVGQRERLGGQQRIEQREQLARCELRPAPRRTRRSWRAITIIRLTDMEKR
jgi:hypothetical protein